jgi:hypothetical protein
MKLARGWLPVGAIHGHISTLSAPWLDAVLLVGSIVGGWPVQADAGKHRVHWVPRLLAMLKRPPICSARDLAM